MSTNSETKERGRKIIGLAGAPTSSVAPGPASSGTCH